MNSHDSDGVHEFVQGQMRTMVLIACQVGEALARAREQRLRDLEGADRQQAAGLRLRLDGERAAAAAALRLAGSPGWAQAAPGEQVVEAVQAAAQWHGQDPAVDQARGELWGWAKQELGLDLGSMQADIDAARAALLADRAQELRGSAEGREDAGAELLRMAADDLDHAASRPGEREGLTSAAGEHQVNAQAAYDTAQRRDARAAQLISSGVPEEAVVAATVADTSNALPVAEAVAQAVGRKGPAKARVASSKQRGTDRSRSR